MPKFIDLTDQRFNKLMPMKCVGKDKHGNYLWLCKCDCGKEKIISGNNLRNNCTKSCGCLKIGNTKHGFNKRNQKSKIYSVWDGMIQRCTNPNHKRYKDYGGRGIAVCDPWLNFENFLKDVQEIPKGLMLDRINNDGNYEPNNWKLSTAKDQARNRRNNKLYWYDNKLQCLSELAEKYSVHRDILRYRLNKGMGIKEALTIPIRKKKRYK